MKYEFDDFHIWHNDPDKRIVSLTGYTKKPQGGQTAAMFVNVPYTKLPMPTKQHKRGIRYAIRTGDKELQDEIYTSVIAQYSKPRRNG